jgi:hypothetical protein
MGCTVKRPQQSISIRASSMDRARERLTRVAWTKNSCNTWMERIHPTASAVSVVEAMAG